MTRAVLIAARNPWVPSAALDRIAVLGYDLVGVVDPHDHRTAHQLVATGAADVILYIRPGDLPSVVHLASGRPGQPSGAGQSATTRRPQPVEPEPRYEFASELVSQPRPVRRRASDRCRRRRHTRT